ERFCAVEPPDRQRVGRLSQPVAQRIAYHQEVGAGSGLDVIAAVLRRALVDGDLKAAVGCDVHVEAVEQRQRDGGGGTVGHQRVVDRGRQVASRPPLDYVAAATGYGDR